MTPASSRCAALCSAPAALCSRGLLALTGAAQDPAFQSPSHMQSIYPGAPEGRDDAAEFVLEGVLLEQRRRRGRLAEHEPQGN